MSKFMRSLLATGTAAMMGVSSISIAQTQKTERPPQFVMLAFDGSFSNSFWQESREFAKNAKAAGKPLAWTYFISGVYWLHEGNYPLYIPPHIESAYPSRAAREADVEKRLADANNFKLSKETRRVARSRFSDIGFGDALADVTERISQVNLAFEEGHEIASHANGHFVAGSSRGDSRKWNLDQWHSEFRQFNDLIFNAYENNGIENRTRYANGYAFGVSDITGFRAPTLDTNAAMFQTLKDFNYTYDTSGLNSGAESPTRWPSRNNLGTWVFPLGYIQVAGTNKFTASMDYNFFVVQSREKEDRANKDKYRDQMYLSYMKYFNDNYYGNRAPVHIGHHFSKWNGGAYWEAMKTFALEVCGKPEVKCVTYQEYVRWLNDQSASQLKAYAQGSFSLLSRPAGLKALTVVGQTQTHLKLENQTFVASAEMDRLAKTLSYKLGLKVDNRLQKQNSVALSDLRQQAEVGSNVVVSAVVLNAQGDEVDSYSIKINQIGTADEKVDLKRLEDKAALGDLSEAHERDHDHH